MELVRQQLWWHLKVCNSDSFYRVSCHVTITVCFVIAVNKFEDQYRHAWKSVKYYSKHKRNIHIWATAMRCFWRDVLLDRSSRESAPRNWQVCRTTPAIILGKSPPGCSNVSITHLSLRRRINPLSATHSNIVNHLRVQRLCRQRIMGISRFTRAAAYSELKNCYLLERQPLRLPRRWQPRPGQRAQR